MKLNKILSTGIFALALTLPIGATAVLMGTTPSVQVNFQDLNLTTAKGKQVLQSRLKRAARKVCGSLVIRTAGSLGNARSNRACYDNAIARAMESIENRYLTASREDS